MNSEQKLAFFHALANDFCANISEVKIAAERFLQDPDEETSFALHASTEPRRQELFRRLNHAPDGTRRLVAMRRDLIGYMKSTPGLNNVDTDFHHLFSSWFNRGFLVLQRITWATPATILEKIIEYEAVHEIDSWDELRARIQPSDRRCYGFFHPALGDDPLIFVEVALASEISRSVAPVLAQERQPMAGAKTNTVVFYSISNCQLGLKGVSFGNFLIKQVVHELTRELPQIKTFVTLSPAPGFVGWLKGHLDQKEKARFNLSLDDQKNITDIISGHGPESLEQQNPCQEVLLALAAHYFLNVKTRDGKPVDPVARFHLGNGARLEKLNWAADISVKGLAQSAGIMVNYLYEPDDIEKNHQAYENNDQVVALPQIMRLLKNLPPLREAA